VPTDIAMRAFELAQAKLPIKTRIVARVEEAA
jgi:ribosomal protein L16/L10AE